MKLGDVAALAHLRRVLERLVDRAPAVLESSGVTQQLGERAEKCASHEPRSNRLLHRETVAQLGDALVEVAKKRECDTLEGAAPLFFLRQAVFTRELDDFVA